MHEWSGYILLDLTHEQEILISLALHPYDYTTKSQSNSRRYTVIQNALFQLGALEASKLDSPPTRVVYRGIFTTYFPNREKYYSELYSFLQLNQCQFVSYFKKPHEPKGTHIRYNPQGNNTISDSSEPKDYIGKIAPQINTLKEWATISDMYIHIPPPNKSLFEK